MKQTITEDQWGELNEKQQLIIAEKFAFQNVTQSPEYYVGNPAVYYPLNIGQMIEFINERVVNLQIDHSSEYTTIESSDDIDFFYKGEELCDALWQAVKEILNV